jgi:carboxypeptidase C (cathepsin A)
MLIRRLEFCFALWLLVEAAFACAGPVELEAKDLAGGPAAPASKQESQTRHELATGHGRVPYLATAGYLPVRLESGTSQCSMFYVSYVAQNSSGAQRPLTFVFNGGPGASSAYLHLGALGPRRVVLTSADAHTPTALVDNPQSWLTFTDLVFVDPVGTGYSRCTDSKPAEDQHGRARRRDAADAGAWDVREDLALLGRFIRLYLTRNQRWEAPKYLVGESYGGFRAAALTNTLQFDFGIELTGVVLISPALDFGFIRGGSNSLLPWVVKLPSYAATARVHGKSVGDKAPTRAAVQDVERFALTRVLPALATGEIAAVTSEIAADIGLPEARIAQLNGKIPLSVFTRELLRDKARVLSSFDGSFAVIDPDPLSPSDSDEEPFLAAVNLPMTAGLNQYVRNELAFATDLPYELLNGRVTKQCNWRSGLDGDQGYVEVASDLKTGMSRNPRLKVLVAHGLYDLVTPYLGSVVVIRQLALDPKVAGNLTLQVYPGGHMFYSSDEARQRLFADAQKFFALEIGAGN